MKTTYISLTHIIQSAVTVISLCVAISMTSIAHAQASTSPVSANTVVIPAASFGGADLSMLTNHAALVGYAFKQIKGVRANVTCNSQVAGDANVRSYSYTNAVKSLDDIMTSILANEHWHLKVTSTSDYFNLSVQLLDSDDFSGKPNELLYGSAGSQPQQNQYGQWVLPSWGSLVGVQLARQIKIRIPGAMLAGAKLIARDQWGNAYPVDMYVDGDGFYFDSTYAGNGTLVLSGWLPLPNQPNWYQWAESAISLKDGSPVALTWVDAQVILTGSSDLVTFKNTSDLSTFIYDWYGYGTLPMGQAVFTQSTTNVLLNTYTQSGQSATSYDVEDQATHVTKTYTVPAGATSVTTGTNALKGTYYIIPQGINLTPWNVGSGGGGGKG